MKNADMPAQPIPKGADNRAWTAKNLDGFVEQCRPAFGLTKREQLAAMAMQGLIANHNGSGGQFELCASHAVDHADALLAELEKDSGDA